MNLIKFLKYILVRERSVRKEVSNGVVNTRDARHNIIKKEYPGGLVVRYTFDILNREREMLTSDGYKELTNYHSTTRNKKEITYYYKRKVWVDLISIDGSVTTEYKTNK
tara:strand:+ start:1192 stop:1518 length:327 start_codon:yes stop_codon:yes gene_type:complete